MMSERLRLKEPELFQDNIGVGFTQAAKRAPALFLRRDFCYTADTMIITYQGAEFFKVQQGDTVVAFNPVSKDSKLKSARFGANVVLVSAHHPDFNGVEQMSFGEKQPVVIEGPGEYETQDIFIKGFGGLSHFGEKELLNTSYLLSIEGMNLCYLGALDGELPKELVEATEDIDVLFVPIGGEGVLEPSEAYKIAVKLEPKVIIPMHYGDVGMKDALKMFLKEAGKADTKAEDKLTIKKKDLEGKEGEVVVLASA